MQTTRILTALTALIGLSLSACAPKGSTQSPAQTQADATPAAQAQVAEPAPAAQAVAPEQAPAQPEPVAATMPPPAAALLTSGASCPNGAKAGESWKVDCNTCSCSESGEIQCTMRACVSPDAQEETSRCPEGVKAGDTWNDACNMCRCDEAGYPVCTLKACIDE